jgi:hypothetical protein
MIWHERQNWERDVYQAAEPVNMRLRSTNTPTTASVRKMKSRTRCRRVEGGLFVVTSDPLPSGPFPRCASEFVT